MERERLEEEIRGEVEEKKFESFVFLNTYEKNLNVGCMVKAKGNKNLCR
jgi:hypothetical protein